MTNLKRDLDASAGPQMEPDQCDLCGLELADHILELRPGYEVGAAFALPTRMRCGRVCDEMLANHNDDALVRRIQAHIPNWTAGEILISLRDRMQSTNTG